MSRRVGLVGARGYVGREMLTLLAGHPGLEIAFAASREWEGKSAADVLDLPDAGGLVFEAMGPDAVGRAGVDAVILGLPNGHAAPFVDAIERNAPGTILIDLSADYRHNEAWVYGLPERHRARVRGARRIANPGCYATAAQLSLLPLTDHWDGPVTIFGLSGYSGAGTTPSRRNDPEALADNAMPYGLVGHGHESEIAAQSGLDIRFSPTVTGFFRGLLTVASGSLRTSMDAEAIARLYHGRFDPEPFVSVSADPAEPAMAANTHLSRIGLPALSDDGRRAVVTASVDNLLKGAASQALQNLNLAMDLREETGLTPKQ